MAYARAPYGQNQAASPWSAGCPPGLAQQQQQQVAPQVQHMFNQPMGAFDISAGAWQQGQHQQAAAQQWGTPAMQQVQFVPNPAYMQPPPAQQMRPQQMQQQQRPMHQRSLSAPRIGANGLKRPMNNNNSFGGTQQQHNNNNRSQQQNGNHYQQRVTRQQSRNVNNNNNNNNNHQRGGQFNNNNNHQQHNQNNINRQQKQNNNYNNKQQQQQQQQPARKGTVKVTKVRKQNALKAKHAAGGNKTAVKVEKDSTASTDDASAVADDSNSQKQSQQQPKVQSKTAERKQLKLQARKNAEGLSQSKLAVVKTTSAKSGVAAANTDEPIDQAQLKCVPAVFGFVCKLCDVFLRDKIARREHIDSEDHLVKFVAFEESEKAKAAEDAAKAEAAAAAAAAAEAAKQVENNEVTCKTEDATGETNEVVDLETKDESSEPKPEPEVDAEVAASEATAPDAETNEVKNEE